MVKTWHVLAWAGVAFWVGWQMGYRQAVVDVCRVVTFNMAPCGR